MACGNVLRSAGIASTMFVLGCAEIAPQDRDQQVILESLSETAYQRAVPRLARLKAGDPIGQGREIDWKIFEIRQRGEVVDFVADGWVGALSGGAIGAGGFGALVGQTGNVLFGEHVFGYLAFGTTLVPQYVVATQATVISPDEYERLKSEKADHLGWTPDPREKGKLIRFKDLSVKETRQLPFVGRGSPEGRLTLEETSPADVLRKHTSTEKFEAAVPKLRSLAPGTDFWEAMAALDMMMVTFDSGKSYGGWFADGYLGDAWGKLTPNGYFRVYRFGYIQNDKEVPRLALITKNHRVYKLVPHGTREELGRHFE